MIQFDTLKKLFLGSLMLGASALNAQTAHPIATGTLGGTTAVNNWYKDYVGTRLEVTKPAIIAGDKVFTTASGSWGGTLVTPLVNDTVVMAPTGSDTCGCSGFPAGSMTGKIALIWRGPLGGSACEFGYKALVAQNAGAIACVIINEYPGEGPVGMAAGGSGASVTIPVFMIGNLDGIAIVNQYKDSVAAGNPNGVKMTITPWGLGNIDDLGLFTGSIATWHNTCIPSNQINGTNPMAYKGLNGAFVANFGTSTATNVKLKATASFTPTGSSATVIVKDSVSLASFPAIDSIYAMYCPNQYNLPELTAGTTGRYDVTYSVTSDAVDQFTGDNTATYSFYATDSLYSKGRYDFAKHRPFVSLYTSASGTPYIWGPTYYVAKGGSSADSVQFSLSCSTGAGLIPTGTEVNVWFFKWVDGANGQPADSFIQNGELQLLGNGYKKFNGTTDSVDGYFTAAVLDSNDNPTTIILQDNSWYYVGAEMPSVGTSTIFYMGCDGGSDYYPRTYGRYHFHNVLEYGTPVYAGDRKSTNSQWDNPGSAMIHSPFGQSVDIDSVVFSSQKGLVANVPLWVNNHPVVDTSHHSNIGVKAVSPVFSRFEVIPNPASDYVNAFIDLYTTASTVTYSIVDNSGHTVVKEVHTNVMNDTYKYPTTTLASGNYYLIVNVDGKNVFRSFTVIK